MQSRLTSLMKSAVTLAGSLTVILFFLSISFISDAFSDQTRSDPALPGKGIMVNMGRADWDTGWFQAEIFKQLLEKLGYTVHGPKTMETGDLYTAVSEGVMDLWPNGWFPTQYSYFEDEFIKAHVTPVGVMVNGGALQGYLIDKQTAEKHQIRNLTDLARPEIARLFDVDGDAKADLFGCNPGWGCAGHIDIHLEIGGLLAGHLPIGDGWEIGHCEPPPKKDE